MKITKKELEKAQELSTKYNNSIVTLGNLELSKQDILTKAAKNRQEVESLKQKLEKKYGQVNIDLATGEYVKNESDKED
jgi:hypothetical protein|tara:strand:+ start:631 stop:867 length:237 start_codon:yes stop_codon:yes gene_type:complete